MDHNEFMQRKAQIEKNLLETLDDCEKLQARIHNVLIALKTVNGPEDVPDYEKNVIDLEEDLKHIRLF